MIDPLDQMRALIKPERDRRDLALFEKRQEQEHAAQQRRDEFGERFTMGTPELPEAQVVFNAGNGTFGVAVRGAKFVCELPKGYERQGTELALIEGGRLVLTHPSRSALIIDPARGTVSKL